VAFEIGVVEDVESCGLDAHVVAHYFWEGDRWESWSLAGYPQRVLFLIVEDVDVLDDRHFLTRVEVQAEVVYSFLSLDVMLEKCLLVVSYLAVAAQMEIFDQMSDLAVGSRF
jgi:hypothetical protein